MKDKYPSWLVGSWQFWIFITAAGVLRGAPVPPSKFALGPFSSVGTCYSVELSAPLRIFRDPSFYLENLQRLYADPLKGAEDFGENSPLITSLQGKVVLQAEELPMEIKELEPLLKFYDINNGTRPTGSRKTRTHIVPIRICEGGSGYLDTLGFVFADELETALKTRAETQAALPPSIYPNEIPKLRN